MNNIRKLIKDIYIKAKENKKISIIIILIIILLMFSIVYYRLNASADNLANAIDVKYNNTGKNLQSNNVQNVLNELYANYTNQQFTPDNRMGTLKIYSNWYYYKNNKEEGVLLSYKGLPSESVNICFPTKTTKVVFVNNTNKTISSTPEVYDVIFDDYVRNDSTVLKKVENICDNNSKSGYQYTFADDNDHKVYSINSVNVTFPTIQDGSNCSWRPIKSLEPNDATARYEGGDERNLNVEYIDSGLTFYLECTGEKYTVTFDANGGSVDTQTKEVENGKTYGELPIAKKEGYTFTGWCLYPSDGACTRDKDMFKDTTTVSLVDNETFYAHYSESKYTVTFDANGGTSSKSTMDVTYNKEYGELPTATKKGYIFTGWYTAKNGGTKVENTTKVTITGAQTLYAHYSGEKQTITFDANGGSVDTQTKEVENGKAYGELPTATKEKFVFEGWYTEATGGTKIEDTTIVDLTGNQTLYAHYATKKYTLTVYKSQSGQMNKVNSEIASTYTGGEGESINICDSISITTLFDLNNTGATSNKNSIISTAKVNGYQDASSGNAEFQQNLCNGGTSNGVRYTFGNSDADIVILYDYGIIFPTLEKAGSVCSWNPSKDGTGYPSYDSAKETTLNTNRSASTYYAICTNEKYTVIFDANGGTQSKENMIVIYEQPYGELATATKNGYTFNGWYTEKTGGTQVTNTTKVSIASNHTLYAHYTANQYTITFDADGGTPTPSSMNVTYDGTYGNLPTVNKTGYAFAGWYTEKTGGTQVTNTTKVSIASNHTLYAHYTSNQYTVTLNPGEGGSIEGDNNTFVYSYGNNILNLPNAKKAGYVFTGWYTQDGTKVTSGSTFNITSNLSLYAHYSKSAFTVTFNGNGGTPSQETMNVENGKAYGTLPTSTKAGYTLEGWYTEKDGGAKIESTTIVNLTDNQTLYAHYVANKYIVTFDGNGGTSSVTTKEVTYDGTYGDLPTASKAGYTFAGWYTSKENGAKIESTTKVNITSAQTLYAHYTSNKYTVTFDGNGGTSSVTTKEVAYDSTYGELPTASKAGYTFNGWHTEKENGTKIESTTKVNITSAQTLYAHYTANEYTVTFDANGGSVSQANKKVTYDSIYGDLPTAQLQGSSFVGWFTAKTGGNAVTSSTKVAITSNQTLYAQYSKNTYQVTLDANGGSVNPNTINVVYGDTYKNLPTPTRIGYTFNGWYKAKDGNDKIDTTTKVNITSAQTLYAHWTINKYKITYNLNGGSVNKENKTEYTVEDSFTINNPSRIDYIFKGWSGTGLTNLEENLSIPKGSTGDKTFTANFTQVEKFTVKFESNGGSSISDISITKGSKITKPSDPTKDNRVFDGWYKDSSYTELWNFATDIVNSNITLYAKWLDKSSVKYTVTFNSNGGSAIEKQELSKDDLVKEPNNPIKIGYTFNGWYSDKSLNTKWNFNKNRVTSNLILYAKWTKNTSSDSSGKGISIDGDNITIVIDENDKDKDNIKSVTNKKLPDAENNEIKNKYFKEAEQVVSYNPELKDKDGNTISRKGKMITYYIPLPEGMNPDDNIKVFVIHDDTKTELNFVIENNMVVFTTDIDGIFSIVKYPKVEISSKDNNGSTIKVNDNQSENISSFTETEVTGSEKDEIKNKLFQDADDIYVTDISIKDKNNKEIDAGENIIFSIPLPDGMKSDDDIKVFEIVDNKRKEIASKIEDNKVIFISNHTGRYVIAKFSKNINANDKNSNPLLWQTGQTVIHYMGIIIGILVLIGALIIGKIVISKRKMK